MSQPALGAAFWCVGPVQRRRVDPSYPDPGLQLNVWTVNLVGLGALVAFAVVGRRHPGRETTLLLAPPVRRDDEMNASDPTR